MYSVVNSSRICYTAVNVRDVTTTRGDDYSTRYDRQVQFNPGEYEKVWRLELINDSIYEIKVRLNRSLQILLHKMPLMHL